MLKDLILKNRSTRHYHQEVPVSRATLEELVDLARLSASAGNRQPLRYILASEPEKVDLVYRHIGLASDPPEGDRPPAYIIILGDKEVRPSFGVDPGIAAQSILLGATEKGLAGCMIGYINKPELARALNLPDKYEITLVVALGKPKEHYKIDSITIGEATQGWWDEKGVRHIPKLGLKDIIID